MVAVARSGQDGTMTWSRGLALTLLITAAFELLLGVGFMVTAALVSGPAVPGLLVTGAILVVVGLVMLWFGARLMRRYREAQRLRIDGVPGQADILEAGQTGVMVNSQLQVRLRLRVTTPVHGTWETTIKDIVPSLRLAWLSEAVPLPVLVDRENKAKLIVDWQKRATIQRPARGIAFNGSSTGPADGFNAGLADGVNAGLADGVKERLLAIGTPGRATVLSATPTGQLDAKGRPVFVVMLHVQVDGRAPATGTARFGVPLERVATMQPGGIIPVKVDPADPAVLAADW
jgi:hypothetical protein